MENLFQDSMFSISMQMILGVRWYEPRISGPNTKKRANFGRQIYDYGDEYRYYYLYDDDSNHDSDQLSDFSNTTFHALDTKFVRR